MNRIKDYKELAENITQWIKSYTENAGIKSLVVGVSGGVDSAVVSTLCAMTGLPTFCIVLDIHSKEKHLATAENHIVWLSGLYKNVYGSTRDLGAVYRSFIFDMGQSFENEELGQANTKARLRMTALYYVASAANGIVVGTGNKVEDFGVGFFTRGGDGCVDISPIGDLMKSEVRELGRCLGVSDEIINAKPTDGLWSDGRTDEDQLKASYDELEWAMWYLEGVKNEISLTDRQKEVLEIYKMWNSKNRFKMLPIPVYKLPL